MEFDRRIVSQIRFHRRRLQGHRGAVVVPEPQGDGHRRGQQVPEQQPDRTGSAVHQQIPEK